MSILLLYFALCRWLTPKTGGSKRAEACVLPGVRQDLQKNEPPHLQAGFRLLPAKVSTVQQPFPQPHSTRNSHTKSSTYRQAISPLICEDFWGVTTDYILNKIFCVLSTCSLAHHRSRIRQPIFASLYQKPNLPSTVLPWARTSPSAAHLKSGAISLWVYPFQSSALSRLVQNK